MPWNGSGVFTRLYSWVADKNAGINITASRMDGDTDDIVTGLENTVTLDGQTIPTHSLPMGGFTHTNVGNATARTNYPAAGQVQDSTLVWGGTSGGSANAQTISVTPAVTALVAGQAFRFLAGFTNTGAATLTLNATAATAIRKPGTGGPAALSGNEIISGNTYDVVYDGTYFILVNQAKVSPTTQVLTSGSGATYTTPAGCRQLQIYAKAGGGGGGGSGTAGSTGGGTGGTTTFNSVNAVGGSGGSGSGSNGVPGQGGTGGTGTATWRTAGASGGGSMSFTTNIAGGSGGGKGGGPGTATTGLPGAANTGGGGGGATAATGGTVSGGGGGGEGEEFFLIINNPAATYTYTIGAGGTAGAAGTSGSNGSAGGTGVIRVVELY